MPTPQAHHKITGPDLMMEQVAALGVDVNAAQYGRWVSGGKPGPHQKWSKRHRDGWIDWYNGLDAHPDPVLAQQGYRDMPLNKLLCMVDSFDVLFPATGPWQGSDLPQAVTNGVIQECQ